MDLEKISVNTQVPDIPRILNKNFSEIQSAIESFFDTTTKTISASTAKITGTVEANSILASNITVVTSDGKKVTIAELIKRIEELEKANA